MFMYFYEIPVYFKVLDKICKIQRVSKVSLRCENTVDNMQETTMHHLKCKKPQKCHVKGTQSRKGQTRDGLQAWCSPLSIKLWCNYTMNLQSRNLKDLIMMLLVLFTFSSVWYHWLPPST